MATIPIIIAPELVQVRTYDADYAPSEAGSEASMPLEEAGFESAEDDDESPFTSIATRLEQNRAFLDNAVQLPGWVLEDMQTPIPGSNSTVVLIRKPTASNMSHRALNPYIYRNIRSGGADLDSLARQLDAPEDWEQRYNNQITTNQILIRFETSRHYRMIRWRLTFNSISIQLSHPRLFCSMLICLVKAKRVS